MGVRSVVVERRAGLRVDSEVVGLGPAAETSLLLVVGEKAEGG